MIRYFVTCCYLWKIQILLVDVLVVLLFIKMFAIRPTSVQ